MRKIFVDPEHVETIANRIETLNDEYRTNYNQLNNEVDILQTSWSGNDNIAFTNQIKGFNDDFYKMNAIISQYVHYLRNSAQAYRNVQMDLVSQISKLTN
ncbi:MAG: WXG100 family type VII secretion target [Erysipelotrichaceae bacterium]